MAKYRIVSPTNGIQYVDATKHIEALKKSVGAADITEVPNTKASKANYLVIGERVAKYYQVVLKAEDRPKVYFVVQDVKKQNAGYKTYTTSVKDVTLYKPEDIKKAISHWKKRKSNDIIMHRVTYLDDMPYVRDEMCFGHENYVTDENTETGFMRVLEFDKLGVRFPL